MLTTLLDPKHLLEVLGYAGYFIAIFSESGLFFGIIFPGDSLLVTAGLIASAGHLNIWILLVGGLICAILGDNVGYYTGKKLGPRIFTKEESWFFKRSYIEKSEIYFKKHGPKTIIFARFIPFVRTFAPMLAGVGNMEYKKFFLYNIIGGFIWMVTLLLSSYFLGTLIPTLDQYVLPIAGGIFIVSFLPLMYKIIKTRFF